MLKQIFNPEMTFWNLQLNDNKKLVIQEYKKQKIEIKEEQIQVSVREWQPDEWKISEPIELIINKDITFYDLLLILSKEYPFISVILF